MKYYLIFCCGLLLSCSHENLTPETAAGLITETYKYPSPVTGFIQLSYDPVNVETWFSVSELEGSGFLKYDTVANKEYPLIPTAEFKKFIIPAEEGGIESPESVIFREATAQLDSILEMKPHPEDANLLIVTFTERITDATPAGLFFDNSSFTSMRPPEQYDAVLKKGLTGWSYYGCYTCTPNMPNNLPNKTVSGFAAPG